MRDAVLVATTTLEVGVEIGDFDLVVLIGAPPGTRSLLQRIGRAGRRIGSTRVLALPRTAVEQAALASMLIAARDGRLEPEGYARRWSVFVQQAASFVAQGRPRGRKRSHLVELSTNVDVAPCVRPRRRAAPGNLRRPEQLPLPQHVPEAVLDTVTRADADAHKDESDLHGAGR